MTLLVSTLALAGCNKDEDNGSREPAVSKQAQAALTEKYPNATNVRWTAKDKYVVASFSLPESRAAEAGIDLAAWFDNGGAWYMTETDIPFTALPEAVQTAFEASEYASAPWRTDDVDMLEHEVVENEFADEVPEKKREAFIRKLLPPVGNVFSAYDLSDDNFALSPEYDLLYTELTGAVVLYIGEYGV